MDIVIKTKNTSRTLYNRFPNEAKARKGCAAVIVGFIYAIGFLIMGSTLSQSAGFALVLVIIVPFFALSILLSVFYMFRNSSGGEDTDIIIDQVYNRVVRGGTTFSLDSARFLYESRYYNNPFTRQYYNPFARSWLDTEVMMDITIVGNGAHTTFSMRIDDFLEFKDILREDLGIRMSKH